MNRKLITMSAAAAVLAFGVTAASADTTVIGSTGQSNQQGVNSSQSGENGSSGGSTYILGDSAPTTTQNSENVLVNVQDVGSLTGATTTLIAPGNDCFCQSSQQGVNSSQVAVNGDGGGTMTAILGDSAPSLTQNSENIGVNVELIGAGFGGDTTLIGGSAQTNDQAFNSAQSGENTSGATGTLVVGGDSLATLDQNSQNALINVALLGS
ncbi:MAG TPA: hypothetical protein VG165_01900 [Solirubrobacteraceae bacterium]|jgi:hypothetical protein|nr:hypothetical protein [Solirubrobacteraceae bacterium]